MKAVLISLAFLTVMPPVAASADTALTSTQFETMERRGWITPELAAAARNLIEAENLSAQAATEEAALTRRRPALEQAVATEDAAADRLKAELDRENHPDETDFTALQAAMKDGSRKDEDRLALAQAYVWTYPSSPHAAQAQRDLRQIEKEIADGVLAAKESEGARLAAQARLLQRVHARSLSLGEWRAFLQDKSEADVERDLGEPTTRGDVYWTYTGAWTSDPETGRKAGLQLNFNGGRVLSVAAVP